MNDLNPGLSSFRSQIGPLLFLTGIFYLNFVSRIVLGPLMPAIEKDLKVGHDEAGSFFLLISMGYCFMVLISGSVSSRVHHKRTIALSTIAVGGALLILGLSHHLWGIRFGLIALGMAAGLYIPSGIATVNELVNPKDLGKAIAIHELAPNFGFVTAPFLVELFLSHFSWQEILILFGIVLIISGVFFYRFGKGGIILGQAPNFKLIRNILVEPSFWIMILFFALGVGASFGVYSMTPLYLVSERGMERTYANTLLGLSRISTLGMCLLAGWMTDRLGLKLTLKVVFLTSGLITAMLSIAPGSWIVLIVFLQPMVAICFFPAGFVALSRMGSQDIKKVTVSLTIPFGVLLGGGAIPAGIGLIGELGSFSVGFIILGGLLISGAILVRFLKFPDD